MTRGFTQKGLQLMGCPGLLLHFGDRSHLGCVCYQGHVSGHDSSAYGVVEGTADDEMDLQHRLGCQGPTSVLRMQLGFIQRLEMVGPEPSDRDFAEGGEDVPVDLAPIPIPRAVRQLQLLAR
ncbi:hypothetical protein BMS3Bbin01_00351 [bacterium BMS3Bbin01]|nr:hypothetical protein BMS3Bbin01_00351 [bacterium BMS3Bbin01]